MRNLVVVGALVALGLASAVIALQKPTPYVAEVAAPTPATHSQAETREQHLAAVTVEAERIEREALDREVAANLEKLERIESAPPYEPDPEADWFAMNPQHIFCDSLTAQTGDRTPNDFVGRVLGNGGSLMVMQVNDDVVQVIDRRDPRPFTTLVFVRGLSTCREQLASAQAAMR